MLARVTTPSAVRALRHSIPRTSAFVVRPSAPRFFSAQAANHKLKGQPLHASPSSESSSSSSGVLRLVQNPLFRIGVVLGGVSLYSLYSFVMSQVETTEGLQRSLSFYKLAIPTYIKYKYMQNFQNSGSAEDEARWEAQHRISAAEGLEKILELKGFYIKNGQMCASNIGNAFPKIWQDTMAVLQDGVPAKDFATVRRTIESELGKDLYSVFSSFEESPIGAASIGQVHRAVLAKDGRRVVVKVQYPEVERLFKGDVRTLILFCKIAQPVHVPALQEIEKQFLTEFDYRKEASQLDTVRMNLIRAGIAGPPEDKRKRCTVPASLPELCTKNVLVMEELVGVKLADGLRADAARYAASLGMTVAEFNSQREKEQAEQARKGELDEKCGPSAKTMDVYIALMDAKRRAKNTMGVISNIAVNWWLPGAKFYKWEGRETLPINHARMIDDLIDIHGHEIFVNGYFNGDPHPGNMMLLDVEKGTPRLGLIDYGQVKALTDPQRVLLSKMMIALADNDNERIADLLIESGHRTKKMNRALMVDYARISLDEDSKAITKGRHIQKFMEDMEEADPIIDLPKDFVMVSRVSIMLRGLGHALQQPRSMARLWRGYSEGVLKEQKVTFKTNKSTFVDGVKQEVKS